MLPLDQPHYSCTLRFGETNGTLVQVATYSQGATITFLEELTAGSQETSYWIEFNFQIAFTVLRKPGLDKSKCYFGEPIGIKFEGQ